MVKEIEQIPGDRPLPRDANIRKQDPQINRNHYRSNPMDSPEEISRCRNASTHS
jgi:hypothetical protein